jgi:hypothetical protein
VARFTHEQLPLHATREGFRCAVASDDGATVGFSAASSGRT